MESMWVNYHDYNVKKKFKCYIACEFNNYIDLTSNDFMWEIFYTKDNTSLQKYISKLTSYDLLILDEFQFLSGLFSVQKVLLLIIQKRNLNQKTTIIISDVKKDNISFLSELKDYLETIKSIRIP